MTINPASPRGPGSSPEANRLDVARQTRDQAEARQAELETKAPAKDTAEVSGEAKALADRPAVARKGESGLSAERLKQISARVADGHYDRPEVIDKVARGILGDPDFRRSS
ncbi:MAG: hypothetical protein ABI647_10145 [Gemmatimonadota bacterium]